MGRLESEANQATDGGVKMKSRGEKGGLGGALWCPTCGFPWAQCVEFGFCGTAPWRLTSTPPGDGSGR